MDPGKVFTPPGGQAMIPAVQSRPRSATVPGVEPAFLIIDCESVPDGQLLAAVKYPGENVTPEEAVRRFQDELRERSASGSDFVPVAFQYPVAICTLRLGTDFSLQNLVRLDEPHYRPRQIVEHFWGNLARLKEKFKSAKLVTFNGRGFDLPLLEMAAFRYGCEARDHFLSRQRFNGGQIDVMDWLSNFGAVRAGLAQDVLAKLLGVPGKMGVSGDQVYPMFLEGRIQAIVDYCMFDTLDLYFIFLRTRVMTGELTLAQEHQLVLRAREFLQAREPQFPALRQYLDRLGAWKPWP
jgi:predicted PolB exonuclease-like 3'-5' exonuclease